MRPVLVYCGPPEGLEEACEAAGEECEVVGVPPRLDALAQALPVADAFLDASIAVRLDARLVALAPRLKVVAAASTGADHIDAGALAARGIPLLTLGDEPELIRDLTPAAEHSWLLLMACARHLRAAVAHVLEGGWDRTLFPGTMLRGRTLGLIGCGRIGGWMARYGSAFGMRVLGHDPLIERWPHEVTPSELHPLLEQSDFVSLHVPLTATTRGLLGRRELSWIKRGAVVVNTSRGEVVDEAALVEALEAGRIAAAGLDVLTGEPDVATSALRRYAVAHPDVIVTPHIGGFSPQALRLVVRHTAGRVLRALGVRP